MADKVAPLEKAMEQGVVKTFSVGDRVLVDFEKAVQKNAKGYQALSSLDVTL